MFFLSLCGIRWWNWGVRSRALLWQFDQTFMCFMLVNPGARKKGMALVVDLTTPLTCSSVKWVNQFFYSVIWLICSNVKQVFYISDDITIDMFKCQVSKLVFLFGNTIDMFQCQASVLYPWWHHWHVQVSSEWFLLSLISVCFISISDNTIDMFKCQVSKYLSLSDNITECFMSLIILLTSVKWVICFNSGQLPDSARLIFSWKQSCIVYFKLY